MEASQKEETKVVFNTDEREEIKYVYCIMVQVETKLELIAWLTGLDDQETIDFLKSVKDSQISGSDVTALSDYDIKGIDRGMEDVEKGRVIPHEEVKRKYGL